ncbi:MAG: HD-GYP domain-containing protein (c-di-GMP phosphodiesterase class II) [bacterium]|jgi:HD-GYP domain-containing protein (c-di-GMP phosphodiesterase class II)
MYFTPRTVTMENLFDKLEILVDMLEPLIREDSKLAATIQQVAEGAIELSKKVQILTSTGVELSKEQNQDRVLEIILEAAREITNSDAGTVYLIREEYVDDVFRPGEIEASYLDFKVLQTESTNTFLGGTRGKIPLPPVPLEIDGKPNNTAVSAYCANTSEVINLPDVYEAEGFDFSGTKKYDKQTGYRSQSMLVIPLRDHENNIIGVLQLINRRDQQERVIPFSIEDQEQIFSISYQTAASITTQQLIKDQKDLFDAFLKVIAVGLGEKSPYTYSHIQRVALSTLTIAESLNHWKEGMYKSISFNKTQMEELELAGWMHDIGKMTTPEHVVSKQIKLQVLTDRLEIIIERFSSKMKDVEIEALQEKLKAVEERKPKSYLKKIDQEKNQKIEALYQDLQILHATNTGGEMLAQERRDLILKTAKDTHKSFFKVETVMVNGENRIGSIELSKRKVKTPLINVEEEKCLLINRGTLTDEERQVINDHAERSWRWLVTLPFPKKYLKLPLYAGAHHETLEGNGYPNKLSAGQLPIQARIIAIADIFEALIASDRPYKKPMSLGQAVKILGFMTKDNHLDAEVMKIFLQSGAYLEFAKEHMQEEYIDEVNVDQWLEQFYPKEFSNSLPEFQDQNHLWVKELKHLEHIEKLELQKASKKHS